MSQLGVTTSVKPKWSHSPPHRGKVHVHIILKLLHHLIEKQKQTNIMTFLRFMGAFFHLSSRYSFHKNTPCLWFLTFNHFLFFFCI